MAASKMSNNRLSARSIIVPIVVVLIATAALAYGFYKSESGEDSSSSGQADQSSQEQQKVDSMARRDEGDPMAKGDVDAPVVMVFYSDFQCPYCGKFARDSEPKLIDKYVDEGLMRIEWRDFPYLGDDSWKAAAAGRAAASQDKFWQFQTALYDDQPKTNSGEMTDDFLVDIAKDIDLNIEQFADDMKSDKYQEAIESDFNEGQGLGVNAAPTFLINGVPIVGAQPLPTFFDAIDDEVSEAQ